MKAVQITQYGGPEVLQLQEVADPVLNANDVLIEVKATTVNRLDLFQRDGSRPVEALPFTPGLEAAGIVLSNRHGFKAGERVLTTRAIGPRGGGGYAGKLGVPAADLLRIPDGVTFEQAAAAGLTASTAWGALFDLGHAQPNERVLIWAGSSGVGSLAIQFAKHAGCWVATTSSSSEKAEELRRLGADLVINHREENVAQVLQQAGGVHVVVELVSTTLQTSIEACQQDGRIVLIGNLGGQLATIDTQVTRLKRVQIIGAGVRRTNLTNEQRILALIAEKAVTPVIARTLPIEQAAEAHRLLASGELMGKIVLVHS
jgi:NADPH:quinone reductase-like Zn-dependent oxidoreductase